MGVGYFALLVTKFGDYIEKYFSTKYGNLYGERGDGAGMNLNFLFSFSFFFSLFLLSSDFLSCFLK
jgi:hypothetical protein